MHVLVNIMYTACHSAIFSQIAEFPAMLMIVAENDVLAYSVYSAALNAVVWK